MKKALLVVTVALLGLFAVPEQAKADPPVQLAVAAVVGTLGSTVAVMGMAISGTSATNVVGDTLQVYKQVCLQNLDTALALCCGNTTNVSCTASSSWAGIVVAPAASAVAPASPMCFLLPAGSLFYCINSGGAGASRAVVVRAK